MNAIASDTQDFPVLDFPMLINGEFVTSESWVNIINPATGRVFARVPHCTEEQLNAAVQAAAIAQKEWEKTSWAERRATLEKLADKIAENEEELSRLLTLEQGKPKHVLAPDQPLSGAVGEIMATVYFMRHCATLELPPKVLQDNDQFYVEMHRRPLGVVGGIVPWNYPILMATWKISPTIMTGNALVLKPSPTTPVATLKLAQICQEVFPPGLVNIVTDNNDIGPLMSAHPGIAKISFTGSSATGKKIMANASGTMKRVTLEMGGNDPCIVLPDVDVKATAKKVYDGAFTNAGQICLASKRAYVHADIYDAFCDELVALANSAIVGDGMNPETTMGPIQNRTQFEKVKGFLEDAKANGNVIAGGETTEGAGFFMTPTIVRDVKDGTRIVDEEQFGPILPVIKFDDVEEVVALANASEYGLGAAIHSKDLKKAAEIGARIESGTVWVNQHLNLAPDIPFAGYKGSGMGVEMTEEGLLEYTQTQVVNVAK